MPVTQKVYQPDGVLHAGATLALAETVGSAAVAVFNRVPEILYEWYRDIRKSY